MIDKVYVLNLPRRTDRRYFMLGHLETIGVPQDKITIFEAKYGRDYKSPNAVIEAAVADGFEGFRNWGNQVERTMLAYQWTWCKLLREIIESDIIALILLDDRMLYLDWETLNADINVLIRNHAPFHVLQVGWHVHPHNRDPLNDWIDGRITRGVSGSGDYATVVSPTGARRILDAVSVAAFNSEGMFFVWDKQHNDQTGLFSYIEPMCTVEHSELASLMGWGQDMDYGTEGHLND